MGDEVDPEEVNGGAREREEGKEGRQRFQVEQCKREQGNAGSMCNL